MFFIRRNHYRRKCIYNWWLGISKLLNEIEIPGSDTFIGINPFILCSSLNFIRIINDNEYYSNDDNGILYKNKFISIICYPSGIWNETFNIPSTVTSIENYSFYIILFMFFIRICNYRRKCENNWRLCIPKLL